MYSNSPSTGTPLTPHPLGDVGLEYYTRASRNLTTAEAAEQQRRAMNLDLVPDDEPLVVEVHPSLSSHDSRLSLEGETGTTPTRDCSGHTDEDFDLSSIFSPTSSEIYPFSPLDHFPRTSSPVFASLTSPRFHQMIHDLEVSQSIDLSHLTTGPSLPDADPFPETSPFLDADSLLRTSTLIGQWLMLSIYRIRRSFRSIDQMISPSAGLTTARLPESERQSGFVEIKAEAPPFRWRRLRNFAARRRSL